MYRLRNYCWMTTSSCLLWMIETQVPVEEHSQIFKQEQREQLGKRVPKEQLGKRVPQEQLVKRVPKDQLSTESFIGKFHIKRVLKGTIRWKQFSKERDNCIQSQRFKVTQSSKKQRCLKGKINYEELQLKQFNEQSSDKEQIIKQSSKRKRKKSSRRNKKVKIIPEELADSQSSKKHAHSWKGLIVTVNYKE